MFTASTPFALSALWPDDERDRKRAPARCKRL